MTTINSNLLLPIPYGMDGSEGPKLSSAPGAANFLRGYALDPILVYVNILQRAVGITQQWMTEVNSDLDAKNNLAVEAARMSSNLAAKIDKLTKPESTEDIPADVLKFLKENNISIQTDKGPQNLDKYLESIEHENGKGLDREQLTRIKNTIDSVREQSNNFSSQLQLKIQQLVKFYENAISTASTMIKLFGDIISGIVRNL